MADGKKISELTQADSLTDSDEFLVVNKEITNGATAGPGGQTSKITYSDLKKEIGTQGETGEQGAPGTAGKSAYDLWLDAGNTGTVEDFLSSLKGTDGTDGTDGASGADGDPGPAGPAGQSGDSGFVADDGKLKLGDANVGIGDFDSVSPEATLHIRHATPMIRLTDSAAPGTADFTIRNDNDKLTISTDPGGDAITFKGNMVGFGTSDPTAPVHIGGARPSILLSDTDAPGDANYEIVNNGDVFHINEVDSDGLFIKDKSVGIGRSNTNPMLGKLHVTGSTALEGGGVNFYPTEELSGKYVELVNRGQMLENGTGGMDNGKGFKFWADSGSGTPDVTIEAGKLTVDGTVEATNFTLDGKAFSSTDLKGPAGPAGPAGAKGADGTNGTSGSDGNSNAHLALEHSSTIAIDETGQEIKKPVGSPAWDAHVISGVGYNSGCVMSFIPNVKDKSAMLGINTDPMANANYNTIDFAWYMHSTGIAYVYEGGSSKGHFGPYNPGDVFTITYDNSVVRYYLNGVLKRTSAVIGAGKTFYLDSSFHTVSSVAYTRMISFAPMGAVGTTGSKGDKGDIGLTGPQGAAGVSGPVGPQGAIGQSGQPVAVASPITRWDASVWTTGGTLKAVIGDKPIYLGGEEGSFGESSTIRMDGSRGKVFNLPQAGKRKSGHGNYIQAGDVHDDVFKTGTFTISFWLRVRNYKSTTQTSSGGQGAVMSKWYSSNVSGTKNSFIIYSSGQFYSAYSLTEQVANTSDMPPLNEWCHMSYVLNAGDLTVYKNGKEIDMTGPRLWGSSTNKSTKHLFNDTTYPLEVGSIRRNGSYTLDGMVDDIRIFDKALSSGEVWFTYNGVGGGGLVGPQGPQGITGSTGSQGLRGPAGPTGPRGIQGTTGANGNIGPTGVKGPKGDTGAKGSDGISAVVNYASNKNWQPGNNKTSYADEDTGGAFTVNGTASENHVHWDIGPFGRRTKIWKCRNNDVASNADGGWNKWIKNLDPNRGYMSVAYVRRVGANTSGSFYHGCGTGTHTLNLAGNIVGNPYFGHYNISYLPKDVWCVSVGYVRANNDNSTTNTNGGLYRLDTGAKVRSHIDYKMNKSGTQQMRNYLYYSTNAAASLDWTLPGFYEVTSDSPTLADLIGKVGSTSAGATGSSGATGPRGATGATGPAGPMPSISSIQNQQFGVLKTNKLDMSGNIELDQSGNSHKVVFNKTANVYSDASGQMIYRSANGMHYFQNTSGSGATINVDTLQTNKFNINAVNFSGTTSTFKGVSNWANVTIDGMGVKAWRGNGMYVHRGDNKMYAQWTMDGLGSARFDVIPHSNAGTYAHWQKWIWNNRLMIDTNQGSSVGLHSTIRTHRASNDKAANSLHILANHGDLVLEANNIRSGVNQQATLGNHGSIIFRAHGVPVIGHVVTNSNSNDVWTKKQRGDYTYGTTSGANAYNRYRQKHFGGNSRSAVGMKLIGGALIPSYGVVDLGSPVYAHRFDTLWCRNAPDVYSDRRAKRQIKQSDLGLDFINKLKPVSYKYKNNKLLTEDQLDDERFNDKKKSKEITPETGKIVTESHGRTHYGMIAQDVEEVLDGKDFGGFVDPNYALEDDVEGKGELHMSLRYEEFISPMIKAIQQVDKKVNNISMSKNADEEMKEIRQTQRDILKAVVRLTNRISALEK